MTEQQMSARIWITAEDQASSWSGSFKRYHASNLDHGDEYPQFVRSDIAERMAEALESCQSALAAIVVPNAIKSTSVMHVFAHAQEAETKARSALSAFRSATQDTEAGHDDLRP